MTIQERRMILLLIVILVVYFLYRVRVILLPFILAVLIAYLINPLINKFVEEGISRLSALIFAFIILVAFIIIISVIIIPAIIDELNRLANRLPSYVIKIEDLIDQINYKYQKIELPVTISMLLDRAIKSIEEMILQFIEKTSRIIINLLSRMLSLVMAPILSFYILKDFNLIKKSFWAVVPKKNRRGMKRLIIRINDALFGFFRGQLIVSVLVALLSISGLYFLQVKFYLLIGILAGLLNVIPYFGPFLGVVPAIIISSFTSIKLVLWVIILFFVIQQVEGSIIAPKIMGEEVGLHPIIIIFSLLAGGELLGIVGMLLAIPVAAITKEVLRYIIYEVLISVDNR